jgi:hypothetical protein
MAARRLSGLIGKRENRLRGGNPSHARPCRFTRKRASESEGSRSSLPVQDGHSSATGRKAVESRCVHLFTLCWTTSFASLKTASKRAGANAKVPTAGEHDRHGAASLETLAPAIAQIPLLDRYKRGGSRGEEGPRALSGPVEFIDENGGGPGGCGCGRGPDLNSLGG